MIKFEFSAGIPDPPNAIFGSFDVGDAISLLSLLVAVVAGAIAGLAWITTSRHNANEHVHRLFSDYIKYRIDHNDDNYPDNTEEISYKASMKLYILEEIFLWIRIQEKSIFNLYGLPQKFMRLRPNDNLESWKRTILVHILLNFEITKKSMEDYACCYSCEFVNFIASETGDRDLLELAALHNDAVRSGKSRPLGPAEKDLMLSISDREKLKS